MQIYLERFRNKVNTIEVVERKGLGHPDTVIDGICESASRELSKFYIKEKGFILHHNLDKGLIVGGVAQPVFGGGKIIQPPEIIVAGTASIIKNMDDVRKLLYDTTLEYILKNISNAEKLSPEIKIKIHPGSVDLVNLYQSFNKGEIPLANDTSFGVGFYPLTKLENMVLEVEQFLNSKNFKKKHQFLGEDIKVMGVRHESEFNITVAAAFISEFVDSVEDYYYKKSKLKEILESKFEAKFEINTADKGENIYLTVSGVSWENGDDGQVGRGNRCNGLITPFRFTSLEAVAGKNPVSHVGKIYNLLAMEVSKKLYEEVGVENEIILVSKIGKPIDEPFVGVRYLAEKKKDNIIKRFLMENIQKQKFFELTEKILNEEVRIF
ncbi:MAG: methionine adenosyltransferase [Candidatus Aenigmatarchaeota archaeon]